MGGLELRGDGSSVFDPLVRVGSFNFQLPMGVGNHFLLQELADIKKV